MQAIRTHYLSPTNIKPGRIKAACHAGSITIEWDHRLNQVRNHDAARDALLAKFRWTEADGLQGIWISGDLPDGSTVHVLAAPGMMADGRTLFVRAEKE